MTDFKNDTGMPGRIIMTAKDVEVLYGCHRTTAGRKLENIRERFNKPEDGDVTIYDFSAFTGIPLNIIRYNMR